MVSTLSVVDPDAPPIDSNWKRDDDPKGPNG